MLDVIRIVLFVVSCAPVRSASKCFDDVIKCPASVRCKNSSSNAVVINCIDDSLIKVLHLENMRLTEFPRSFFANMSNVIDAQLQNNTIGMIDGVFEGMVSLMNLHMSSNHVEILTENSFGNLTNLRTIAMSSNRIREIGKDTFKTATNLMSLYLNDNLIKHFHKNAFSEDAGVQALFCDQNSLSDVEFLSPLHDLRELDLSSNLIDDLPENTFAGFSLLQRFLCAKNSISNTTFLKNLIGLTYLDLRHNLIDEIPLDVFNLLKNITRVYLSFNKIQEIRWGTFSESKRLILLDLAHNNLHHVGEFLIYLPELRELILNNNNLEHMNLAGLNKTVVIAIDNNKWTCSSAKSLMDNDQILLKYERVLNVTHYAGIPCNADAARLEDISKVRALDNKERSEDTSALMMLNVVIVTTFISSLITVVLAAVWLYKYIRQKRAIDIMQRLTCRSVSGDGDRGYMTPVLVCQNIYEEIGEFNNIVQEIRTNDQRTA